MKKILILITVFLIISIGAWYLYSTPTDESIDKPGDDQQNGGQTEVQTFKNEGFGFEVKYPKDWNSATGTDPVSPKFNFYTKPQGIPVDPPFDHLANITNTSVFPQGIPTEEIFSQTIPVNEGGIDFPYDLSDDSEVYVLEDNTPFAAYLKLAEHELTEKENWNDSGFIWVRAYINNMESRCMRDGEEVGRDECDPLVEGDQIIRTGEINEKEWEEAVKIAESFTFLEADDQTTEEGDITITSPEPNQVIESPLELQGKARGSWFFEATAPVLLVDEDGQNIARGTIEAQGDWMTENFVEFKGEITFEEPENLAESSDSGTLIFQKANPSGLPENDEAMEIPVLFR
ncbi:MAG: Gmad2 immunoglobulin-like domain-containing protein [Patescibacteria group bacterium]